jgi:hypothetical protein
VQLLRLGSPQRWLLQKLLAKLPDAKVVGSRKRAIRLNPIPRRIIGIEQRAEGRRPFLICQARELAGRVIQIRDTVGVRQCERGAAIRIVVANRHRAGPLLHLGQPVRIVEGKGDLRLAHDRHCGSSARIIIGIIDRPLRRDLLRQPIESIIRARDRRGDRPTRILFLHLRDAIPGIIRVVRGGAVLIGGDRAAVQRIVGVRCDLALAIRDRGDIPVVVIGVGLGIEQGILSRPCSVHIVVRIHRLLGLGIRDGEEIAVRIIRERRIPVDGIGKLRDAIQRIGRIEGLLHERVGHGAYSARRIQNPLRFPVQRIFDLHQIPRLIGEHGHVAQGIGDRQRLALGIHRNRGRLAQGIRDGREIPFGIVAERGGVIERIGDGGMQRKVMQ